MKLRATFVVLVLVTLSLTVMGQEKEDETTGSRSTAAQPNVVVSLCMLSGSVDVKGWDKNEVKAQSMDSTQIEFRRVGNESALAAKVDVIVLDTTGSLRTRANCQSSSDMELMVPRGATVHIQSRDGDISITEVAVAYAGSQNGTITLDRVTQASEAGSIGGDIYIKDSFGRIDLNTIGGAVEVTNVRPVDPRDIFEVVTVSGDVELMQVSHSQLNVRTVNGNMRLTGPLQPDGRYGINTMSGDVTFALPANASFRLNAKVSSGGDIITDFPLTLLSQSVSTLQSDQPANKRAPMPHAQRPHVSSPAHVSQPSAKAAPAQPGPVSTPKPAIAPPTPSPRQTPAPSPAEAIEPPTPPTQPEQPLVVVKVKPTVVGGRVVRVAPIETTLRRVTAICGTGEALISVASFSGTLHLQKN
jgi:hypothetical protein